MPKIPADQVAPNPNKMLGAKAVADDLDSTIRSLDRWISLGIFPPEDMRILRRRFWSVATVEKAKRDLIHANAQRLTAAE
jgi:hypothetical protein